MIGLGSVIYGQTAPERGAHRIELRHPRWADYESWLALREANRDHLKPWEPEWNAAHLSRASYKMRLGKFKRMTQDGTAYPFHVFLRGNGGVVGACNLTQVQRRVSMSAQLGYWVGAEYAGRGIATAAVRAAVRFSFLDLGLHRVEAAVRPGNAASERVLEKCGFAPEGLARGYLRIDGDWRDHRIWARLSSD